MGPSLARWPDSPTAGRMWHSPPVRQPSRRAFFGATAAVAAGSLTAACETDGPRATSAAIAPVPPTGRFQAGIVAPQEAQATVLVLVVDLHDGVAVGPLVAELGKTVQALTAGADARLFGLPPGDLTVTIGIGPRLVRMADPALPGAEDFPEFPHEQIPPSARGGDLLLQICASDPMIPPIAAAALLESRGLRERWRQSGHRGTTVPVEGGHTAPRNLFGFTDGIVGPRTTVQQHQNLWLPDGPATDGTIAVLRRIQLDLPRFAALPVTEQEAVFGRRRHTSEPLSGGTIASDPDLTAKTPDGRYRIPADAHVRRAHPTAVGVGLMLRRSYSITDPAPGLLFISFQNDIRTFTKTLTHMSNGDALLPFTTTTAGATFLILPGFDDTHPLGATVFR
ncbi:Dyp-type peroxidase [Actinokineospora globicatena]|uniref:Dyp-type peroxidase n=1 Tax=Actinokineospora globicatena TaxID=103729 RepID=UPI0032D9E827